MGSLHILVEDTPLLVLYLLLLYLAVKELIDGYLSKVRKGKAPEAQERRPPDL